MCLEGGFKHQRGGGKEGGLDHSEASFHSANILRRDSLSMKTSGKTPLLNLYPLTPWSGPKNIAQIRINDEGSWALLDNGSTINAVTPESIEAHSLDIGLFGDLVNGMVGINVFGGLPLILGLHCHKGSGRRAERLQ